MNTTEKKERLLLITTDERLEHLLAAEALALSIPMRTERSASVFSALPPTIRLIIWDMDTVAPIALPTLPECPIYGLTRHKPPSEPPLPLARILHRPFSVDLLRTELLRTICAEQPLAMERDPHLSVRLTKEDATLHIGESSFSLTENEAVIMSLLLQHRGQTVTKEALRQALAKIDAPVSETTSNKVEVYLCRLRTKLELPLGRRLFTTVRGRGYRLDLGDEHLNTK